MVPPQPQEQIAPVGSPTSRQRHVQVVGRELVVLPQGALVRHHKEHSGGIVVLDFHLDVVLGPEERFCFVADLMSRSALEVANVSKTTYGTCGLVGEQQSWLLDAAWSDLDCRKLDECQAVYSIAQLAWQLHDLS